MPSMTDCGSGRCQVVAKHCTVLWLLLVCCRYGLLLSTNTIFIAFLPNFLHFCCWSFWKFYWDTSLMCVQCMYPMSGRCREKRSKSYVKSALERLEWSMRERQRILLKDNHSSELLSRYRCHHSSSVELSCICWPAFYRCWPKIKILQ